MLKRVVFTLCCAILMGGCGRERKKTDSPATHIGDKPIVIGDGNSVDIDDSGFFAPLDSNKRFTAAGDLMFRKRLTQARLAAYQESGVSKADICTGKEGCSITVTYAKAQQTPDYCNTNPADDNCGTVKLLYIPNDHTVTVTTKHSFNPNARGIYELAGYQVIEVTWAQGPDSNRLTPSDPSKHNSSVKMCFVEKEDSDKPKCDF